MKPVITPSPVRHVLQIRLMRPDRQVLKRRKHLDELPASQHLLFRIPPLALHSWLRLIGIIFNAYAQLRIRDLALLERLSLVSRSMPSSSFDAQAIGNIFHALATLNVRDDALIDHMATTILRSRQTIMQTEDYNGQALANIAWSMAVLQLSDVALNRWICRMCARSIASMDTNALCQLHQVLLALIYIYKLIPLDPIAANVSMLPLATCCPESTELLTLEAHGSTFWRTRWRDW